MTPTFPPTVIVRHRKENPRKCSILPLAGRSDVVFCHYPVKERPPLEGYVRLAKRYLMKIDEIQGLVAEKRKILASTDAQGKIAGLVRRNVPGLLA